jgi:hypothetical protein
MVLVDMIDMPDTFFDRCKAGRQTKLCFIEGLLGALHQIACGIAAEEQNDDILITAPAR